jgi:hypothetical protein
MVAKKLMMCIGVKPFRTRSYRSPRPTGRKNLPYAVENTGNKKSAIFVTGIPKGLELKRKEGICFSNDRLEAGLVGLVKNTRPSQADRASVRKSLANVAWITDVADAERSRPRLSSSVN